MTGELPSLRASDTERERVAEALRQAVAEGRLDMEEFDTRLSAAYEAKTHADLEPLVRDLPEPGTASRATGEARTWRERIGGKPSSTFGLAILGGFQRKGQWTVPRRFTSVMLMGGGEIDLREARFESEEVTIRCFAFMGGGEIILPPDIEAEVTGIGIMGGFDHGATGAGTPGAPRVKITGFAIWGGVDTKRKNRKKNKKSLDDGTHRELED